MKNMLILIALLAGLAFAQDVNIAGSSTVYPISLPLAEEWSIETGLDVSVASTGTGGGFTIFCRGETDITGASRPIADDELAICEENGIDPIELLIAFDALTVAVNNDADWIDCMTVAEVKALWEPDSSVTTWADIRPEWPAEDINLFGAATTSGTFDYFTEEIIGEEGASRTDYFPSEEDDILAENVANDINGLVYFGYAYYVADPDRLKAVAIDDGNGCVEPSVENIENGSYTPLSRPLFLYVSDVDLTEKTAVQNFVEFALSPTSLDIIAESGYATLDASVYEEDLELVRQFY
jgi:phosphate transport system substrate-binding protein